MPQLHWQVCSGTSVRGLFCTGGSYFCTTCVSDAVVKLTNLRGAWDPIPWPLVRGMNPSSGIMFHVPLVWCQPVVQDEEHGVAWSTSCVALRGNQGPGPPHTSSEEPSTVHQRLVAAIQPFPDVGVRRPKKLHFCGYIWFWQQQ
jgi:hypothetical protein